MSANQVEEFYMHYEHDFSDADREAVESILNEEGFSNYSFENKYLIVDDICSEHEGDELEEKIESALGV